MSLNQYSDLLTLYGVGGLVWYVLYDIVTDVFTYFNTYFPGTFSTTTYTFMIRLWDWFPLIIVIAGLIMVTVSSNREARP